MAPFTKQKKDPQAIRTLAILQARMSSSRLPGKTMKKIIGRPMLELQIERIKRSKKIDKLILATSTNTEDNEIEALCKKLGLACFRGDLENVLDRFYNACKPYNVENIVRLTGDCPLTDPEKIDELISFFQNADFDYVANCTYPTLPHGLDAEIFSKDALEKAYKNATLPSEKEHVTTYIKNPDHGFSIGHLRYDGKHAHLRWTVDEPQDFELVKKIYERLYPKNPEFTTADIIQLMDNHPELLSINTGLYRDEGYQKSLKQDRIFLGIVTK